MLTRVGMRRVVASALAASLAAMTLAACGGGSSSVAGFDNIAVGIALSPPKVIFLGPYVAEQEGFFKQEHLNVKFISMPNGLETELGTTSGSINFGFSSATDAIESASAGSPIHAIWSYGTKLDTACVAAPSIQQVSDLIGKPVGSTGTGGFSYTLLNACLAPANVDVHKVKPVNMERSAFVPALVSGRIFAAVFHADDAYVVTHKAPGLHVLVKEYETYPNWWYGGVTTLDSYAKANPDVVKRFLIAMMMADRWMNDPANHDALVQLGVKVTGEDQAAVDYAVTFMTQGQIWPNNQGLDQTQVDFTTNYLHQLGEIPNQPSYSQIVNSSYADAAVAALGQK
ncbi:MAG: ABC transporter substrate-binding protein [Chloroflexota bacterium]|nr:ABC transporter substrate-binding protein [Chloroflexota bacterium]